MAGTLGIVTLVTWVLTASIGGCMLASIVRASRRNRAARPPVILAAHFGLALSGLAAWAIFVAGGWAAAAWTALGLLMVAIGLGLSTVTIWTPFPGRKAGSAAGPAPVPGSAAGRLPGGDAELAGALADAGRTEQLIDELLAGLLAGPQRQSRRPRVPARTLIPVGHGIMAGITFVLAVLTVAGLR